MSGRPNDWIKRGTHKWCATCVAKFNEAKAKWPDRYGLGWPQQVARFTECHYDENDAEICNYHGNPEFNPEHDCERNCCG